MSDPAPTDRPEPLRGHVLAPRPYERVAFLSDPHFPYADWPLLHGVFDLLRDWHPDLVILGGDQADFYSISDYSKDPGRASTVQADLDSLAPYWKAVDALGCDVVAMEGNHDDRLVRLIAKNPGLHGLRALDFPALAGMPARFAWARSQTHYQVGGLIFLHGDLRGRGTSGASPASGMLRKLRHPCLFGHLHRFDAHVGTTYGGDLVRAYANGHLGDTAAMADYCVAPDWQRGISLVEFDPDDGDTFTVHQVVARGSRLRFGGRTYGG